MIPKAKLIPALLIIVMIIFASAVIIAFGDEGFEIKRIGNIHPYADNAFRIKASEAGSLEIRIHDNVCVYRRLIQRIPAGETIIHWDGCGYNREKLYEKTYTVTAELTDDSGNIRTISFDSPVEYPAQCLQYALPSSANLFLDHTENWFLEFRTVTKGTVAIEIKSTENDEKGYTYLCAATGGKIARLDFSAIAGRKEIPESGEYIMSVYETSKQDERYEFDLHVIQSTPDSEAVAVTGEIMPDRSMSDAEMWEMMMKPSVVVDIDSFKHQEVYEKPDVGSKSLGTLHGQSQGLKVISIENEWAMIGAWNHEDASYVEGWVPLSRLKTVYPHGEYGILIDKKKQTMTVFRNGEVIDTLLVSTGRAEKNSLYQETSAGCFLTGYHRVDFSMNGKKYDYVIQYDGGNLLHQTPYDWGQQKKDFTLGRAYLGTKASHACIRIQPEPGEGGLNAYWLFTHIPYHTRVIIFDDPEERTAAAEKLKRTGKDEVDIQALHFSDNLSDADGNKVVITFGGCMIPGGSRSFNSRNESIASFVRQKGYGEILKNLTDIFAGDDLTVVNIGCIFQKEQDVYPEKKEAVFAPAGMEKIFENTSIELMLIQNDRIPAAETDAIEDTLKILSPYAGIMTSREQTIYTIKGHKFGFAGCTQNEYLKDPETIDRKISNLKNMGCEKTIMLFSWSAGQEQEHSIVQEAMAHRSIRAGADLVVGNSQGIVQGLDIIEGVPVIYSTGDLVNGSTFRKPKNQQGILCRIVFDFNNDEGRISISVIPVMPYGGNQTKENEYIPSIILNDEQQINAIQNIWRDSTYAAMEQIQFYRQ